MMIAQAAAQMGVGCICLDPSEDAPAASVCKRHIVAAFDDMAALDELCRASDVVTYEFENVPAEILRTLDDKYHIRQGIAPLCDSQDRLREKTRAVESGLECPRFADITDIDSLRLNAEAFGYPCVLKTRRLGYDGHGQKLVARDPRPAVPLGVFLQPEGVQKRVVPQRGLLHRNVLRPAFGLGAAANGAFRSRPAPLVAPDGGVSGGGGSAQNRRGLVHAAVRGGAVLYFLEGGLEQPGPLLRQGLVLIHLGEAVERRLAA